MINKLALEIYEQNKTAGWWDNPDRCIYEILQLVSTEIAEATEGERKNLMDDHLTHRKMGEVELADALIRLLDIGGRYRWEYVGTFDFSHMLDDIDSIAGRHMVLNIELAMLATAISKKRSSVEIDCIYTRLINGIFKVCRSERYDVMMALAEKVVYNKNREDHKRENRDKEHGKKF